MGISIFKASSCVCNESSIVVKVAEKIKKVFVTEKEKKRYFEIIRTTEHNGYVIAELRFPEFKNYNGHKVCVYRGTKKHLLDKHYLDPHFCEGKHLSPLARFIPTEKGWSMAITMIKNL